MIPRGVEVYVALDPIDRKRHVDPTWRGERARANCRRRDYAAEAPAVTAAVSSGGGTSKLESGADSSSGLSRPRVACQYFGASSR